MKQNKFMVKTKNPPSNLPFNPRTAQKGGLNLASALLASVLEVRAELKFALAFGTLGVFVGLLFAKFDLCAKAVWAFEVGQHFLDSTPLRT